LRGTAASSGSGTFGAGGGPASHLETTNETTTATITTGITLMPLALKNSVVSRTAVIGSCSIPAVIAPTPIAAPVIIGRPARCDSAIPPAAPMNMPGKVGPPRKLLSAMAYAMPLHTTSSTSAPTV
jgi:hypothetical protein